MCLFTLLFTRDFRFVFIPCEDPANQEARGLNTRSRRTGKGDEGKRKPHCAGVFQESGLPMGRGVGHRSSFVLASLCFARLAPLPSPISCSVWSLRSQPLLRRVSKKLTLPLLSQGRGQPAGREAVDIPLDPLSTAGKGRETCPLQALLYNNKQLSGKGRKGEGRGYFFSGLPG